MNVKTESIAFRSFLIMCLVCLCFGAAHDLAAQEAETALIYRVEGVDFAITQFNERIVISADAARGGGIILPVFGMVNTGPDTFLEIQLVPSGTVIKLAENTSLIYNGLTDGNADLGLLYGRIRVVTGDAGYNPVVIKGGGISVQVEEGDLGVDYFLDPEYLDLVLRPFLRAYVFRGSAMVSPYESLASTAYFGRFPDIHVEEGWRLSIDISSSFTYTENTPLDSEIRNYWIANNFAGISPLHRPNTTIAVPSVEYVEFYYPQQPAQPVYYYDDGYDAGYGTLQENNDWMLNNRFYVRASVDYPVSFYLLKRDGLWKGKAMYAMTGNVVTSISPVENSVVAMPALTLGLELPIPLPIQLPSPIMNAISVEPIIRIGFGDPVSGGSLNLGVGAEVKLPLLFIDKYLISPYAALSFQLLVPQVFSSFPRFSAGIGVQASVKGFMTTDAFFVDVNFMYNFGDAVLKNQYRELFPNPPGIHYQRLAFGIGIGYRYGLLDSWR